MRASARPMPAEPPVTRADFTRASVKGRGRQGGMAAARSYGGREEGGDSPRVFFHVHASAPSTYISRHGDSSTHVARARRRLRREVLGCAARDVARRARPGGG